MTHSLISKGNGSHMNGKKNNCLDLKLIDHSNFSYLHLLILGLSLGILGQLGDLSESLMKRDCEVKDSGKIFPGLGGALDCIDSLLFTAPVFYFWVLHFGM